MTITDIGIAERFWSKVDKSSECWIWIGSRFRLGYGSFRFRGKLTGAHRVAWELVKGPIPESLHVLHVCDVRSCVNPNHLFLGTHADNMSDMRNKGRMGTRCVGQAHHAAKLCVDQVRFIEQSPESSVQLSKTLPVDASTIRKIRRGVIWQKAIEEEAIGP